MNSAPYHFVRCTWITDVDDERLARELSSSFEVVALEKCQPDSTSITGANTQEKYVVKADTLHVYLSRTRATLFQKEKRSFTEKDVRLRDRIFAVYRHSRSTPLPWGFMQEPHFEMEGTSSTA
jgi:hypothetical protein